MNSSATYYEYDELGRMRFVKDDYKNVVKMYEYNLAKKVACPVTYSNLAVSLVFIRNNCAPGYVGGPYILYHSGRYIYLYTKAAGFVNLMVSEAIAANGQAQANTYGPCLQVFSSAAISIQFKKDDCPVGYEPAPITYTVPAGTYSSSISQADADAQAQEDIDANGQAYANANGTCVISYNPQWESTGNEGCLNNHKTVEFIDINPNSATYGQTYWEETDEPMTCDPSNTCVRYLISMQPGTNTNNLYVYYVDCNDVIVNLHWDTQMILNEDFQKQICAKGGISLRYGPGGLFIDEVAGITIENIGVGKCR